MWNLAAIAHQMKDRIAHLPATRTSDGPLNEPRSPIQPASENQVLNSYLQGWAEADLAKILVATAPSYGFYDPLVGRFSRRSLHDYFSELRDRLSGAGVIKPLDITFVLSGPIDAASRPSELQFWREAPRIGLTGTSMIEVGTQGVIAESVAYDLNLASDLLRCSLRPHFAWQSVSSPAVRSDGPNQLQH
jgi:hypothetical protein